MFAPPLKDPAYFKNVAVAPDGHSFGWNLDELYAEIDLCADATRYIIEAQIVFEMSERFRRRQSAAE